MFKDKEKVFLPKYKYIIFNNHIINMQKGEKDKLYGATKE